MNERGSILVETLIATTILAMILAVAFQTLHDSARRARRVADQRIAMLIAQSHMAEYPLNRPPAVGRRSGDERGFRWRVEIDPATGANREATVSVVVSVASERDPSARVRLDSLRPAT
ncbi:type II secretion system protein [Sphingobium sp. CAP-1]|uniref:type II secretion system protein n=1 Tax=Sphingobium sp. CAP-1 TaxID=2676077 RepID=UPI0012BB2FF8|nr:type II secretion system protein [Sphingobium sp. CAP-1]QGP80476.1 hypothetical protein GL174_15185 [Sphingobium sp. CAP-1]